MSILFLRFLEIFSEPRIARMKSSDSCAATSRAELCNGEGTSPAISQARGAHPSIFTESNLVRVRVIRVAGFWQKMVTTLLPFVPAERPSPFRRFAASAPTYPCYPRYPWLRVALNVPCLVGLSPTSGANSTSPVIASGVSNFPLEQKHCKNLYRRQRRTRRFPDTNPTAKPGYRRCLLLRAESFGKCRS